MFQQITVFDPGLDLPRDVNENVREFWADREFGNDNYYGYIYEDDILEGKYPALVKYLTDAGYNPRDVLIHYWW